MPTGECWCGCGSETGRGSFFVSGHDKRAESMLIRMKYKGVAEFVADSGYSPAVKKLLPAFEQWRREIENQR